MPIIDIHGMKVKIPEGSHSAEFGAEFLKRNPENAKAFFDEAKRNSIEGNKDGRMHFKVDHRPVGYHGEDDFTLIHTGHDEYELHKKSHHIF